MMKKEVVVCEIGYLGLLVIGWVGSNSRDGGRFDAQEKRESGIRKEEVS